MKELLLILFLAGLSPFSAQAKTEVEYEGKTYGTFEAAADAMKTAIRDLGNSRDVVLDTEITLAGCDGFTGLASLCARPLYSFVISYIPSASSEMDQNTAREFESHAYTPKKSTLDAMQIAINNLETNGYNVLNSRLERGGCKGFAGPVCIKPSYFFTVSYSKRT